MNAARDKLKELDPSFKAQVEKIPLTKEQKAELSSEMDEFLESSNKDDEALQGKASNTIFENPKEAAAERIGKRKTAEDKRLKGNDCMKSKDFKDAIRYYNASLELDPHEALTFSNRAQAHLKLTDYSKCIEDSNIALELKPDYVKAFYRRGMAYKLTKKFEEAIRDFQAILEQEPSSKRANQELLECRAELEAVRAKEERKQKSFTRMVIEEDVAPSSKVEVVEPESEEPVIEEEEGPTEPESVPK